MKILIVGGGGREHALAWRLRKSPACPEIIASPGNPGMASLATCYEAPASVDGYRDLAERAGVDFTVVGPEAPLVAGIVDRFRQRSLPIVGPTGAAAQLEGSKLFAKSLLSRAGVPTAQVYASLDECRYPVVVKADGLAAGKGVVIAANRVEAELALEQLGPQVLLEEFLEGEEISYICLTDGRTVMPFAPTQDHKRALDGDRGPNTGGMGAYSDRKLLDSKREQEILDRIIHPVLRQMSLENNTFTGFLYAGLMLTEEGPKVLEFNARLGDPEAQALMMSLEGDFAEVLANAARQELQPERLSFAKPSACVVLATAGYPEKPITGDPITGLDQLPEGVVAFQAGTATRNGRLVTNAGRVLGITASGQTLPEALHLAYQGVTAIHFEGMHFRRDIGQKGVRRW